MVKNNEAGNPSSSQPGYQHTQRGKLHLVLLAGALLAVCIGVISPSTAERAIALGVGLFLAFLAYGFRDLTISDAGDHLQIAFGPIPIFRRSFSYGKISDIEVGRSTILHGWGIHGFPGFGWTYNIWGFDCVKFRHDGTKIILGTDDAEKLAAWLRQATED